MLSSGLNAIRPRDPSRPGRPKSPGCPSRLFAHPCGCRPLLTLLLGLGLLLCSGCGENTPPPAGGAQPKMSAAFDAAAQAGQTALDQDRPDLARTHFETALKEAAVFPEADPRVAMTWMYLGTAQAGATDFSAAETSLKKARALAQVHQPAEKSFHADIDFRLGDLYRRMNRADDADSCLTQAADALKPGDAATAILQARILRSRALTALMLRGQPATAEPLFHESLARWKTTGAAGAGDEIEGCTLLNDYATCCLAQQKLDPAAALLAEAETLEKTNLLGHRVSAETQLLQGKLEFARKNFAAAETKMAAAFAFFEKAAGVDAEPTFRVQRDLAEAQYAAGHKAAALEQYETYVARYQARTQPPAPGENPLFARVLTRLAGLYVQEQQLEKALTVLEKLQQFYHTHAGPDSPALAQTFADRATLLKQLNRGAEAAVADAQAQAIRAKQPAPVPQP